MHLIQILLPRLRCADEPAGTAAFTQTRTELVEAFQGVTAYLRSPAQGAWAAPDGNVEQDDVVMVEVLADGFDRTWWRQYAETLALRFRQQSIHIRAMRAQTP